MKNRSIPGLRIPYTAAEIDFIKDGITEVLNSGYLTMGKKVIQFEQMFGEFVTTKHAIAVNSGTSSLEIVLRAIGIEGATVVIPSNTFIATAVAVIKAGGKVIFVDCQRENLQLDPRDLRRKIRDDTRGVILVHIGGIISPHLDEIKQICDERGLFLFEDAAHAHGATIDGRKAGSLGIAGSFSFYPTKVMVTGEGGMITTDDDDIYNKSVSLRDHGRSPENANIQIEFGYNWRFSELHALLGIQQMMKIEAILVERRKIAQTYDRKLDGVKGIRKVELPPNIKSTYYKYIVFLEDGFERDAVKAELKEKYGVSLTGEVYAYPCHVQPVFKKYPDVVANNPSDTFPETEYVSKKHICLPLYSSLTEKEVVYVVDALEKVLR